MMVHLLVQAMTMLRRCNELFMENFDAGPQSTQQCMVALHTLKNTPTQVALRCCCRHKIQQTKQFFVCVARLRFTQIFTVYG